MDLHSNHESRKSGGRWPEGFDRIPDEDWLKKPVEESAMRYNKHGSNAFNKNWDPTIAQVLSVLDDEHIILDYSCGTGLFTERLFEYFSRPTRILNVDVSPKYLRVVADKFKLDDRVALRLQKRISENGQLQSLDDTIGEVLLNRGIDILTSANAVHLYPNLADTFASWNRVLRRGGLALVSTGDMSNPKKRQGDWRLHDTVEVVHTIAQEIVKTEPLFEKYRHLIDDDSLMLAYKEIRSRVYPPIKPIDLYLDELSDAGLEPLHHFEEWIEISTTELIDALVPYHDVVLGWIGGSEKVEGDPPTQEALRDRLFLMKYCATKLYMQRDRLRGPWTYITCRKFRD
ncbi:class I SAM-dependent methyltransferase [Haloechinothrix halophila]|uniref:class I SAM-dependent methyltransferase n=1 Tax=Haloechinothrix halophila TaxID=1069073 RepID=UPI00146FC4EA|nr:methyltransferase domain-containing protein [Haloechinothrix halophila]